jgi:hypothetical protein
MWVGPSLPVLTIPDHQVIPLITVLPPPPPVMLLRISFLGPLRVVRERKVGLNYVK